MTSRSQRVNITIAARLTGRSEKTIRLWLAEDPCPLSVEWGPFRGGRRIERSGKVIKGRTRLLDVDELRTLHFARHGTEWHDQHLPPPAIIDLLRRIEQLEANERLLESGKREHIAPRPTPPHTPSAARPAEREEPARADASGPREPARTEPLSRDQTATTTLLARHKVPTIALHTLPAGWERGFAFARRHGVGEGTMQHQFLTGAIPCETRPNPTRSNEQEYWLRPEHQHEALRYWRESMREGRMRKYDERKCKEPSCPCRTLDGWPAFAQQARSGGSSAHVPALPRASSAWRIDLGESEGEEE